MRLAECQAWRLPRRLACADSTRAVAARPDLKVRFGLLQSGPPHLTRQGLQRQPPLRRAQGSGVWTNRFRWRGGLIRVISCPQHAAERFLHRVLDAEDGAEPRVIITDRLASYVPAVKRVMLSVDHRRHRRLNNRAENSHRPVRKRERAMQRFKSREQAQRFLKTFSAVCNNFRPRRHHLQARQYHQIMHERFLH